MMTALSPSTAPQLSPVREHWQNVIGQIRALTDANSFNAYIRDTKVLDFTGEVLTIAAPSAYARDWLASRLTSTVTHQVAPLFGRPVRVAFVFPAPPPPTPEETPAGAGAGAGASDTRSPAFFSHPLPSKTVEKPANRETVLADALLPPVWTLAPDDENHALAEDENADHAQAVEPDEDGEPETLCGPVELKALSDTIETALLQTRRIIAFPRYELRFIPLVGSEAFFLRLAFLQERFFHTGPEGRAAPFETSVDALIRWANVGRATLHRFKKGDPARGQLPAAGWFGIEQMPNGPRAVETQRQPLCRYRIQQGIPLTPMDADRLYEHLIEAGIRGDPVRALQTVCSRPAQEILAFPPPAPAESHKRRTPVFTSPAGVVQKALTGQKIDASTQAQIQEWTAKLADHITMPQQLVFVSWYFMQHWLPILGHDAAALVLYARSQGYYNPQDHELRDVFAVPGGYRELADILGLKRDRTVANWLPNLFERKTIASGDTDSETWQNQQQHIQQMERLVGQFIQVVPGSRWKTDAGHYGFKLQVEIQGEPLTPTDQGLREWVQRTLSACADAGVLPHFHAWVTALASQARENQNDVWGTLGIRQSANGNEQIDVWGILGTPAEGQLTFGESEDLNNDVWGILGSILNDGAGILARFEMTFGELFKGLLRLNTYWETILNSVKTTASRSKDSTVVDPWDLRSICMRNGGINAFREAVIARESTAAPFMSWLIYAYSFKGHGIQDPVGWALTRIKDSPGLMAEGLFGRLAAQPPDRLARWLLEQIETGAPPIDDDWSLAFRDVPGSRLREMAEVLGLLE